MLLGLISVVYERFGELADMRLINNRFGWVHFVSSFQFEHYSSYTCALISNIVKVISYNQYLDISISIQDGTFSKPLCDVINRNLMIEINSYLEKDFQPSNLINGCELSMIQHCSNFPPFNHPQSNYLTDYKKDLSLSNVFLHLS